MWNYTDRHHLFKSSFPSLMGWWFPILSYSHFLPPINSFSLGCEYWFLTERQFKACVEQHQVESGLFGATDLIISHDDLRVKCEPLPRTFLRIGKHFAAEAQTTCRTNKWAWWKHVQPATEWVPWVQSVQLQYFLCGAGGWWQTSFDCRMPWRGIHTVPTMVSQINPLFHTSTVRPRSKRLISLDRKRKINRKVKIQDKT